MKSLFPILFIGYVHTTMMNTLTTTSTASYAAVVRPIHFVVGGGAYMTRFEHKNDFEHTYPHACLFCGIPNGKPIISTTSDPCITNAPTMQPAVNQQRVVHTAVKVLRSHPKHNNNNNVSKSINSYFKAIKKFVIRKQLYLFATMFKRRFAF